MKQGLRTLTLAAAVAAGTLAPAVPAGASPAAPAGASPATPAATAEPAAQAAARRYCLYGGYAIAKENIKIRTKPKVNATPLGLVLKNKTFSCHHGEDGERYTLCGKTSAVWQYITYNGMTGYIPGTCTKPRS
ncbi:hypothetical protein AB0C18_13105 [Nonomuraea muscovyensis]|uniref:hypothetical protein n=1 Tax=Nonomuraea muscovyensis TaxID=1124761 RepID=UPI0033FF09E8